MKLITLNVWGGRVKDPLRAFLEKNNEIDIFCFQEVYHDAEGKDQLWVDAPNLNFFSEIRPLLESYNSFFHPHLDTWWGLGMFIKKEIPIEEVDEIYVHREKGYDIEQEKKGYTAKNIQYFKTFLDNKKITIINFHGLWNGQGKSDTEDRLNQSKKIIEFIKTLSGEIVLCGDFNLSPDTESLKMIENAGLRNLVKEFGITSTRTSFYAKENKFADYILVSRGIQVKEFMVLPEEVSDHAALYLDFDI